MEFLNPQTLKYYVYYGLHSKKWRVAVSNDTLRYGTEYYTKDDANTLANRLNKKNILPRLFFSKI